MNTLTISIILAVACIGVVLLLVPSTNPELFSKLRKFLFRRMKSAAGRPALTPEQEEAKAKAKKLAPYQGLATKIEQVAPGQTLRFKIPEGWGGNFITVQLNPQYPQSGKKYTLCMENAVQGMPGGQKTVMYEADEPLKIACSIMDRNGELFVVAGEAPVNAAASDPRHK